MYYFFLSFSKKNKTINIFVDNFEKIFRIKEYGRRSLSFYISVGFKVKTFRKFCEIEKMIILKNPNIKIFYTGKINQFKINYELRR